MKWNKIETARREDIEKVQLLRLQDTLQRVYALTPFYKKKFDELKILPNDIKSLNDISKLPFTKKQDLRNHYPFGLFTVPLSQVVRVHSSLPEVLGFITVQRK